MAALRVLALDDRMEVRDLLLPKPLAEFAAPTHDAWWPGLRGPLHAREISVDVKPQPGAPVIELGGGLVAFGTEDGVAALDEEMADLMKYQRAFQASSRVFSAVDDLLDLVVNRLGIH